MGQQESGYIWILKKVPQLEIQPFSNFVDAFSPSIVTHTQQQ
jgi:hypothetical protein